MGHLRGRANGRRDRTGGATCSGPDRRHRWRWRRSRRWRVWFRFIKFGSVRAARGGWLSSWSGVAREGHGCRIAFHHCRVWIRQIAAGRSFGRSVQIDRGGAYRRIRIEVLRSYQQTTVKRAELLTFIRKGTITLGASLHTGETSKRESDLTPLDQFERALANFCAAPVL